MLLQLPVPASTSGGKREEAWSYSCHAHLMEQPHHPEEDPAPVKVEGVEQDLLQKHAGRYPAV